MSLNKILVVFRRKQMSQASKIKVKILIKVLVTFVFNSTVQNGQNGKKMDLQFDSEEMGNEFDSVLREVSIKFVVFSRNEVRIGFDLSKEVLWNLFFYGPGGNLVKLITEA